jgi:hypothetical protein
MDWEFGRGSRRMRRGYGRSEWDEGDRDERTYARPTSGDAWSGTAVARGRRDDDRDDRFERSERRYERADDEMNADWGDRFDRDTPYRRGEWDEGWRGRESNQDDWRFRRSGISRGDRERERWGSRPESRGYREVERDFGFRGEYAPGGRGGTYQNWDERPRYATYPRRDGGSGYERSSWTGGQFSGRGPRGYRRSDERIWEEACEILAHYGELDASEIDVQVRDGEVTLEGTVDSRWSKRLAEDLLEDVRGVHDVHNRLRVQRVQGQEQPGRDRGPRDARFGDQRAQGTGSLSASGTPMGTGIGTRAGVGPDMLVVSSDNDEVGTVKELRASDFLVDRALQRDIYVPFNAVRTVEGGRIILNMAIGQIDDAGWESPPLVETGEGTTGAYNTPAD